MKNWKWRNENKKLTMKNWELRNENEELRTKNWEQRTEYKYLRIYNWDRWTENEQLRIKNWEWTTENKELITKYGCGVPKMARLHGLSWTLEMAYVEYCSEILLYLDLRRRIIYYFADLIWIGTNSYLWLWCLERVYCKYLVRYCIIG